MVEGVTSGRERLEIQGVGYRAALEAKTSSSRSATPPGADPRAPGIEFSAATHRVVVKGSPSSSSETAAIVRKQRPPEPYKGKGIRYEGEHVVRKVGKRA
jgi:large subunit ribosomal protein L6